MIARFALHWRAWKRARCVDSLKYGKNRRTEKQKQRRNGNSRDTFNQQVNRRVERKLNARKQKNHSTWSGLGMFGLVGWSVTIPTPIGFALGLWLDQNWPGQASWTLNLLIIGTVTSGIGLSRKVNVSKHFLNRRI